MHGMGCVWVQVKEGLGEVLKEMQRTMEDWVYYDMSSTFLSLIMTDLKRKEDQARAKVFYSSPTNLEM